MDFIVAALIGIGLAMLWQRALPVAPVRSWAIIRLSRLYDTLTVRKLPRWPIWWLKGALGCEDCLCPYLATAAGFGLGLGAWCWGAGAVAFALYHLAIREHKPT
jgi:hypothetical protein